MQAQAFFAGRAYLGRPTQPQAISFWEYRRRLFVANHLPRLALLLAAAALYTSASSPWVASPWRPAVLPAWAVPEPALVVAPVSEPVAADLAASDQPAPSVPALGHGLASRPGLSEASITNILIAISFLDGYEIEPGGQLSFDDVARTWDFREDERYRWGPATARYGPILMRGGGVCWLSTALWRAALAAGLRTDYRQNHYGLVSLLGAGSDATNILVIRNDSAVPITVRAWLDDEDVNVALFADEPLDRTARIRGPERLGRGSYVLHQDVFWADGRVTTSPFQSGYYW